MEAERVSESCATRYAQTATASTAQLFCRRVLTGGIGGRIVTPMNDTDCPWEVCPARIYDDAKECECRGTGTTQCSICHKADAVKDGLCEGCEEKNDE